MNARTVLPLAVLTAFLSVSLVARGAATASMPDNEAQAKARAALNEEPPAATSEPVEAPTATATVAAAPSASLPDTEVQAEARALMRTEVPESEPSMASEPEANQVEPAPEAAAAVTETAEPAEEPAEEPVVAAEEPAPKEQANSLTAGMTAPALPTTPAQQAQLNELLQQYRADQISASEYHARRAEIIAAK